MPESQQLVTRPVQEILGRNPGYGFAGTGVSTAIGNYTETDTDLSFPGGLLGLLDWARTYNSRGTAAGVLGVGWSTTFSASLTITEQGILHHTAGPVQFHDVDGRILPFTPNPAGGFTRPQDLDADLTRNADGTFTLTYNSGEAWSFDAGGRLTGMALEGQAVTLDYSDAGLLLQAMHSSGRSMNFTYDGNGRLTQAEANDGRTVSYAHAADGTLSSVTLPGGGTVQYASTNGMISSVTSADGNLVVANTYTDDLVSHQDFPAGGAAGFGYDTAPGVTTVTSIPSQAQVTFQANPDGRLTKATDPFGNASTFGYDADGRLARASTPGGTQLTQSYDTNGNLLTSTFGGATTALTYDAANRVTSMTDPVGGISRYSYGGGSHIPVQVSDPSGGVTTQTVDNGLITSHTDADGNTTGFGYDTSGNMISVADALGQITLSSYDASGNHTGLIAPSGASVQWAYDAVGRLISATDPNGAVTSYRYSSAGLLLQMTDPTGAATAIAYTAAAQVASVTDPLGRVTVFGYDADGNVTTITDPAGAVTEAAYDELGRVTSLTDPTGSVTTLLYDADGNMTAQQTPAGTMTTSYDPRGNPITVTDPAGAAAQYTYDAADRLTSTTGPDGSVWATAYDGAGNIIAMTDPLNAVTRQAWTPAGRTASVTDPLGRQQSYARDKAGRVTEVTDAEGGLTQYAYNADGRKISATTPAGLVTQFSYDAAGRLVTTTDPRGWITQTEYNARGEKIASITPDGAISRFVYDTAGQLTEVIDPNGSVTQYAYDEAGRVTLVTDAKGAVTRFGYDAAGRQTSVTDPLGRVTTSAYDKAGNLITLTDPAGHTQDFSYDADRRLIRKTAGDAVDISYTYDPAGHRTSMTDATGTTHYAYDTAGRLLTATEPDGATTTAAYDGAGQRTSLVYPDGLRVSYTYDGNGRLIGMGDSRAGNAVYALDADGRILTEQIPRRLARRYHNEGGVVNRLLMIRDDQPVSVTDLTRDPAGRIASQHDGSRLIRYHYDPAGQLVAITTHHDSPHPGAPTPPHRGRGPEERRDDVSLTYDAVGNRVSLRRGVAQTRYRYDLADQLLGSETGGRRTEYRYDPSGRLIEEINGDTRRAVTYDGFGRPVTVTRTSPGMTERAQATFDGDGLLVSLVLTNEDDRREEQRAASVSYVWGSFGQVPQVIAQRAQPELDDADSDLPGRLSADFSYGYGRTFASTEHHAAAFHHDAYGSALRTEDTAAWVQADRYDTFGTPDGGTVHHEPEHGRLRPPELPRFGYRGELALGPMVDLRARTYDTSLGRFTSRDLISPVAGPSQAANPYTYANNDPLNFTDPLGTLAFGYTPTGALVSAAAAADRAAPTVRPPLADCPGGPSPATLNQLSQALRRGKPGDFAQISNLLHINGNLLFPEPAQPPTVRTQANNYTCGRFGTGCGGSVQYQNSNTAVSLGWEFLTGLGSRNQNFNQWDPFTQMLMRFPWIQELINTTIKPDLYCGTGYSGSTSYQDPKWHIILDIPGAFTDGRIGSDPAEGFLGSFGLTWAAVPISEKKATVFFTVKNTTDLNSLVHPEFISKFALGPFSWFSPPLVRSIDGARPEFAFFFGPFGPLSAFTSYRAMNQTIQWQETIGYTYTYPASTL
jgi:RHS repeat-associated protein